MKILEHEYTYVKPQLNHGTNIEKVSCFRQHLELGSVSWWVQLYLLGQLDIRHTLQGLVVVSQLGV